MRLKFLLSVDIALVSAICLLAGLGFIVLFSASGEDMGYLTRHAIRFGLAFMLMLVLSNISPQFYSRWSIHLYLLGLLLLTVVLVVGTIGKGAQRWLDLGILRFQPSEIMKLAVPMMVAWLLTRDRLPPDNIRLIGSVLAVLIPVVMIMLQPDLGTALLIGASGLVVIFLAGIRWRILVVAAFIFVVAIPVVWLLVLHDYQRIRILTLLDPWSDPLGAGYHTIQASIAIGAGGLVGKGWLSGSQSQLDFIPERSTDFIFAVLSEEFGLLGVLVLIGIYLFLVLRGIMISFYAKDTYSRLLAGSISATFFFYVFVNIGMVSGMLPVVGVPLPLVSYGGTSMVTLMMSFGILMSIHKHR